MGKNVSRDETAIRFIVDSLKELLINERRILEASAEADDEGTNAKVSDFITEQEKTVWTMKAWRAEEI